MISISMTSKEIIRRATFCQFSLCRSLVNVRTQVYKCDVNSCNIECRRSFFMSQPNNNFISNQLGRIRDKTEIKKSSCLVYEILADTIDYVEFLKYFKLPDTFQSWFLAIALHVWMTVCISISEKQGRLFRNGLLETMWNDIEERLNQLNKQGVRSTLKKESLKTFADEFKAALVSYDEGILSNDMVLAAAVWRMFFQSKEVDPRLLEDMVFYIRRQINHLDTLHMESLLKDAEIYYLPLKQILEEKNAQS